MCYTNTHSDVDNKARLQPSCEFHCGVGHGDGHLPADESSEPSVGHFDVEWQLRNPDAELDEARVSSVLDDDRG